MSIVLEVTKMLLRVMRVQKASIRASKDKDLVFHVFQARTTINSSRPSVKSVQPIRFPTHQNNYCVSIAPQVKGLNQEVLVAHHALLGEQEGRSNN